MIPFHIRVKKGAMKQFLYTLLEDREVFQTHKSKQRVLV